MRRVVVACAATALISSIACEIPPSSISLEGRPSAVAVARGVVWIADDGTHSVHAIEADTRKRIARIRVARNPIAIDATDDAVWVAHAGGEIVRIDARRRSAGEPFEAGGSLTGVAANGSRVWATDLATNSLIELDARTSRRRRVYRIGAGTVRVAVAGDYLWVTNRESSVIRVDPARTRSVLSRTSGSAPSG